MFFSLLLLVSLKKNLPETKRSNRSCKEMDGWMGLQDDDFGFLLGLTSIFFRGGTCCLGIRVIG